MTNSSATTHSRDRERPAFLRRGPFLFAAATATAACATAFLLGCTVLAKPEPERRTVVIEIVDTSLSASTDRCAEVAADLQVLLDQPSRRDLDVIVLAVGSAASGNEPVPIVSARFRASSTAFEEPGAEERHRHAWLASVVAECDAGLVPADRSPVFLAVKRGLETASAFCARVAHDGGACVERRLYVHSDLRDNVEPAIRARLYPPKRRKNRREPPVPRLETDGVHVFACGLSETRAGAEDRQIRPDAVLSLWKEILGEDLTVATGCARLPRQERAAAEAP